MAESPAPINKWGNFEIALPPPFMEPIIDGINQFLEIFAVLCDIVLVILQVVKVFLIGLVSPILAILDIIIAIIEGLVTDLRQAGLYMRGDWSIMDGPIEDLPKKLRGGYQAYENRVFEWFTDPTDPKRPDISTQSGVFALFFFAAVDYSEIEKIIKILMSLVRFFKAFDPNKAPLPTATNIRYSYVYNMGPFEIEARPGSAFKFATSPLRAKVEWDWASSGEPTPLPIPLPQPAGALVEVSTVPELLVGYSERAKNATNSERNGPYTVAKSFFPSPQAVGEGPLKLYGGVYRLSGGPTNAEIATGTGSGARGAWVQAGPREPAISVKEWKKNPKGLQRTFFVKSSMFGTSINLDASHMPLPLKSINKSTPEFESDPASSVYLRVTPLSGDAVKALEGRVTFNESTADPVNHNLVYNLLPHDPQNSRGLNPIARVRISNGDIDPTAVGRPSLPITIALPNEDTAKFLQMVQAAGIIALTSGARLDDQEANGAEFSDDAGDTGLAKVSKPLYAMLSPKAWDGGYFENRKNGGQDFRDRVLHVSEDLADRFMKVSAGIPKSVISSMVERHYDTLCGESKEGLIADAFKSSFTSSYRVQDSENNLIFAGKATIFDLLGRKSSWMGIHKSYEAITPFLADVGTGVMKPYVYKAARKDWTRGDRLFLPLEKNPADKDADYIGETYTKVPYMAVGTDTFMNTNKSRQVLMATQFPTMVAQSDFALIPCRNLWSNAAYDAAAQVLGIANKNPIKSDGEWMCVRPFGDILAPLDGILQEFLDYLYSVRDAIAVIIEQIVKFIRMMEAKVQEIQALIRKIQAFLAMLKDFSISGDFSLLMLSSAGTQGLLNDFMMAEEKPSAGPGALGAGCVMLAGGWPLILVELFELMLAPSDEG